MLRAARAGLKGADRSAHVMLSGLFGKSWISLEQIYGAGARKLFDSVAVHPYTRKPEGVLELVRRARAVMARNGDRRKPISVTEVSWVSSAKWLGLQLPFVTDEHGQAERLERVYRLLAAARRRLGIERVQWYTWLTRGTSVQSTLDYAGLLNKRGSRVSTKPAYGAFERVARRLGNLR